MLFGETLAHRLLLLGYFEFFWTGCLGNPWFASQSPVVFVTSVVSVASADPAFNPLVCSCPSHLCRFRHFRDSLWFREGHPTHKT